MFDYFVLSAFPILKAFSGVIISDWFPLVDELRTYIVDLELFLGVERGVFCKSLV